MPRDFNTTYPCMPRLHCMLPPKTFRHLRRW